MFQTLLIPTDGSACARRAVEGGLEQAATFGAHVHFLYVLDTNRGAESDWDLAVEQQEATGERALEDAMAIASEMDVPSEPHLRRGTPHEQICSAAKDYDADIVIMGTCGRSGLERFLRPGSTTQRVIQNTTRPVTVIPPDGN